MSVENINRGSRPSFWIWHQVPVVYLYRRTVKLTWLMATYDLLKVLQRLHSFLHGTMQNFIFLHGQGLCTTQQAQSSSIFLMRTVSRYVIEFLFFWYERLAAIRLACNLTTRHQRNASAPIYGH
jgi:hypothetical protein